LPGAESGLSAVRPERCSCGASCGGGVRSKNRRGAGRRRDRIAPAGRRGRTLARCAYTGRTTGTLGVTFGREAVMRAAIDGRRRRSAVVAWSAAVVSIVTLPLPARPQADLPGIGPNELTAETFSTFTSSVKMIPRPESGPPEAWFSAAPEHVGTVASATPTSVTLLEPMVDGLYAGLRIRVTGSSPAAGQILDIDTNRSSTRIDLRSAFSVVPQ